MKNWKWKAFGLLVFAAIVNSIVNPSKPEPPVYRSAEIKQTAAATPTATVSNEWMLRAGSGDIVMLAISQQAEDRFCDLAIANDVAGIEQMMRAGLIFSAPSGTPVMMIRRGFLTSEVRIIGGIHAGRSGFVNADWVQRSKS